MSASNQAAAASTAPGTTGEPRNVEVYALREIAHRLEVARETPDREAKLLQVVRLNWRLWTIFQVSLLEADCPVPEVIRNNILSLANFVDKHSADIIAAPAPSKLDVLIRLNHDLADGLSGNGAEPRS